MKKINLVLVFMIGMLMFSCSEENSEEIVDATFKVVYFEKTKVGDEYLCSAIIEVAGLTQDYSIDGILYANAIKGINVELPFNEEYKENTSIIDSHKMYFNIYGKHRGSFRLRLTWTSEDNRENYLVGWHLSYGFGLNCEPLMVDLQINKN